jgi:hypothetical protein
MQIRDDYLLMPVSRTQTIPESQITGRSQKLDAKIHIARLAMAQKKRNGTTRFVIFECETIQVWD